MIATRSKAAGLSASLAVLLTNHAALGHDFWIQPACFRCTSSNALAAIEVTLQVGEEFKGEPAKVAPEKIEKFVLVGPEGDKPVQPSIAAHSHGSVAVDAPGDYLIAFRGRHSFIELSAKDFEEYLRHEGLSHVLELRKKRGESETPARELYARFAKALIRVGNSENRTPIFDRPLGFPLEIIPQSNPSDLKPVEELKIKLLFQGAPLEAAQVTFMPARSPASAIVTKTDAAGTASAKLTHPGEWMVKSIHMIPSFDPSAADWESFWATLTFEIGAASSPDRPDQP